MVHSSPVEARLDVLRQRAAALTLREQLAPALGDAPPLTPLVAALAREGQDLEAAAAGNADALWTLVQPAALPERAPITLHTLALCFEQLAEAVEGMPLEASRLRTATALRAAVLEAWQLLASERSYLEGLLGKLARGDEQALLGERVATQPARVLTGWCHELAAALSSQTPRGLVMLRLLRTLEVRPDAMGAAAARAHQVVVDAALEPLRRAAFELTSSGAPLEVRVAGLIGWANVWASTENDLLIALAALGRLVELGWELRSGNKASELAGLHRVFAPMLEQLASDVAARGPSASYASTVADAHVQMASGEQLNDAKIALAERALQVCPRHPLAESVLAYHLAQRGLGILDASRQRPNTPQQREIEALVRRAESLDPEDARVKLLRERYRAATGNHV